MFYFSYNIVQTAYYNLTLAIKYSCSDPVYNLIPALAIIWEAGPEARNTRGRSILMVSPIFGRITVMEMGNCRAGSRLRFTENPAAKQKRHHQKSGARET